MVEQIRTLAAFLIVVLGVSAAALDTSVNIAFPSIIKAFGLEVHTIRWVVISYMLAFGGLMLVFGRLGDIFGHRRVFQTGLLVSTTAFTASALAPSFGWLLFGRVLQGVGLALVVSCGPALSTSLYAEQERTRILGIYGALFAIGNTVGLLVGGALVELWGWSAVFSFRIPLMFAALALSWLLPDDRLSGSMSTFDARGAILLAITLNSILLVLTSLQWNISTSAQLGLAISAMVAFWILVRHLQKAGEPIIPLTFFRDPIFSIFQLLSIVINAAAFAVLLFVPLYLVLIIRMPALWAGMLLAVSALGTIIGSLIGTRLCAVLGNGRTALLGMFACAIGLGAIGWWPGNPRLAQVVTILFLQGVGLGLFQISYNDLVTSTLPLKQRGVAGSLIMVTRTIGIVGGASGLSALFRYFRSTPSLANASASDAFLGAFQSTFTSVSLAVLFTLTLCFLRPRIWLHRLAV
jgi:MFS family permease